VTQRVVDRREQPQFDNDHGARRDIPAEHLGGGLPETEAVTQAGEAVVVGVVAQLGEQPAIVQRGGQMAGHSFDQPLIGCPETAQSALPVVYLDHAE
jgi:hypothetical protein